MSEWLVTNAELVNEGRSVHADARMRKGRIEPQLNVQAHERVFDAQERWLLPSMIDEQVHFREPGLTHKADIEHESRACVAVILDAVQRLHIPLEHRDPVREGAARPA